MNEKRLRRRIFYWILFFIFALLLSGITAFPLDTELAWLNRHGNWFPVFLQEWFAKVYHAVHETQTNYPFLSYGTDWLAFAHIIIALALIGPLRDPVRNRWIIDWAILSCFLVIPLALIAGPVREIPFFHRLVDCAFGIVGLIPLFIVRHSINKLEILQNAQHTNK